MKNHIQIMDRVDDTQMNVSLYDALKNAGVKEEDARKVAIEFGKSDIRFIEVNNSIQGLYSHIDQSNKELRRELRSDMKLQKTELKKEIADAVNESTKTMTTRLFIGLGVAVTFTLGVLGLAVSILAILLT